MIPSQFTDKTVAYYRGRQVEGDELKALLLDDRSYACYDASVYMARSQAALLALEEEYAKEGYLMCPLTRRRTTAPLRATTFSHQAKCLYCHSRGTGTHCGGCGAPLP